MLLDRETNKTFLNSKQSKNNRLNQYQTQWEEYAIVFVIDIVTRTITLMIFLLRKCSHIKVSKKPCKNRVNSDTNHSFLILFDVRLSPRHKLGPSSSGMLGSVDLQLVRDVIGQPIGVNLDPLTHANVTDRMSQNDGS